MLTITPTLALDESELEESFVRASGPGGQNVNKVATAVQLGQEAMATNGLPLYGTPSFGKFLRAQAPWR